MDVFDWLLHLEDASLSGQIVSLNDGAGLTRFGLTSRDDSTLLPANFFTTMSTADALECAKSFYKTHFWDRYHMEELGMPLAASFLSAAVVCGYDQAMRFLEWARGSLNDSNLLPRFITRWQVHNEWVARTFPNDARFLRGWNARATSIYPALPHAL